VNGEARFAGQRLPRLRLLLPLHRPPRGRTSACAHTHSSMFTYCAARVQSEHTQSNTTRAMPLVGRLSRLSGREMQVVRAAQVCEAAVLWRVVCVGRRGRRA
jgi:hypothetical protein